MNMPSHNLESEKAVLGSILLENDLLFIALQKIDETYFYHKINQNIFKVYKTISEKNSNIDILTLIDILSKKTKNKDNIQQYVKSLLDFVSTEAHFNNYIEILIEHKKLRDLLNLSIQIQNDCENKVESETIINSISKQFLDNSKNDGDLLDANQISRLVLEKFESQKETFLKTGIKNIDDNFQGINTSGLLTLSGLTGNGKTTLALNIAENHIRKNKNVLIFQMEMETDEMLAKMLSYNINVPTFKIKEKLLNKTEKEKYFTEVAEFANFNYKICDRGNLTIDKIVSIIQVENKKKYLDLIVIDYLGLINTSNIKSNSTAEKIGYITKTLKALSRDLKTHIILLAQLNREVSKQSRYPKLSDLKESSSIEQDSDVVMFTHYDDKLNQHKIIIAKNRHGECKVFDIYFDKLYSKFI